WIDYELRRRALVEVLVTLRTFVEADNFHVDSLRHLDLVMEDRHHELPVVLHNRALSGEEVVRLRPAEANANAQVAGLCGVVDTTRVVRNVETGDTDSSARARDRHQ